jgi:hypothetical protein
VDAAHLGDARARLDCQGQDRVAAGTTRDRETQATNGTGESNAQ